ncbi:MAG: IMPACT family protein [Christensenellaceae bacterium]|jgi:uncharacterized YigZ family protein|nr:IMPACT family protein [Christensenellaceae bacterium]
MDYTTVAQPAEFQYEVKKSKFTARVIPITDLESGLKQIEAIRETYKDATHNCYAIIDIPDTSAYRFSDDGEPADTAGRPILSVLLKNRVHATACIITRYFGGIKLGTGGLTSAYTYGATEALKLAGKVLKRKSVLLRVKLTYSEFKLFELRIRALDTRFRDVKYSDFTQIEVVTPETQAQAVIDIISAITQGDNDRYKILRTYFETY